VAQSLRSEGGGIRSLRALLTGEHAEAIEADLLERGWHLYDIGDRLSWHELRVILENLPPNGTSALYRARFPDDWWYDTPTQIASAQLLALQGANWQRGGGKGSRPKLFEPTRPEPERKPAKVVPIDKIKDELAARRARARAKQAG